MAEAGEGVVVTLGVGVVVVGTLDCDGVGVCVTDGVGVRVCVVVGVDVEVGEVDVVPERQATRAIKTATSNTTRRDLPMYHEIFFIYPPDYPD